MAALKEYTFGSRPHRLISSRSDSARSHCPPFSHAEMAALRISSNSASARSHCPPFSHAEMAAL
eukprot:scaffold86727_cov60-Phaeocystis_antarctica.AAC.4